MLEWIKKDGDSSGDEPMRDPVAAKKLLAEMCDADPLIALNDMRGWLESLAASAAPDERVRVEILGLAQEAGQRHADALLAQFFAWPVPAQRGREANWIALIDYLKALSQAFSGAVRGPLAPTAAARALNAARMLAKAHLLRYLDVPAGAWRLAYSVHAQAETLGCAETQVRIHAAQHAPSSATRELLRLLMLQASAPEMLAPAEIEVADRAVEQVGAEFTLRPPRVLDNVFCFDPAGERAPIRTESRPAGLASDARCFGAGAGIDALQRLYKQLAPGREERPFGKDIASHAQISALQHLLGFWGPKRPYKEPERAPAAGELRVVHGYAKVWQQLSHAGAGGFELALVEDGGGAPQAPETWRLHDSGGNELGAEAPGGALEWARCGEVVAVSTPEAGDAWWPAIVRSVHARPDHAPHVTFYVLSRAAQAVQLQARIEPGEEAVYTGEAARQFDFNRVRAIIVSEGAPGSHAANMLLAPEGWKEGRVYELASGGATRSLRGLQILRRRDDYVRATFEWAAGAA
ncbi:MAG: hypothetical protein ACREUK_13145 [Burkholderiales bacterium]